MARTMDYDGYAATYANTRWAFQWVVKPLEDGMSRLKAGTLVLEIGCGTANYIAALAASRPDLHFAGFDRSVKMLDVARSRFGDVDFRSGDAEDRFPAEDGSVGFAFCVDVIHHIEDLEHFFREAYRILTPRGRFLVVTDSEENIRSRSLTHFFPEILDIELDRYPRLDRVALELGPDYFLA